MSNQPASSPSPADDSPINTINRYFLADEGETVTELLHLAKISPKQAEQVTITARKLVQALRISLKRTQGLNAFLQEYDLSSREGVALMCIAEALLRIPDKKTKDALIADKLTSSNWHSHLGTSDSLFVNASTWALMLTGKMVKPDREAMENPERFIRSLIARLEEPVLRSVFKAAMSLMGHQYVMAETIGKAMQRTQANALESTRYTFDMLGEAALTRGDAERFQNAYITAIETIGAGVDSSVPLQGRNSVSVKLSALYPRFEYTQQARAVKALTTRLIQLVELARRCGIGLTIDAEESEQLEMTLQVFMNLYLSDVTDTWEGLGLAVQAYQKRGIHVIRWLDTLSRAHKKVIPVRLVKGAYWDAEIKHAQELGLSGYPVFTRKGNTDVSYLACARLLLDGCDYLYPQFATHNAHTLAYIYHTAADRGYEFQYLHGMGEALYQQVAGEKRLNIPCRVYAPVGAYEDLLPYLVRRLLENGANTSFINQTVHDSIDIETVIADPVGLTAALNGDYAHPKISLPSNLFRPQRCNSAGINFADAHELSPLLERINRSSTAVQAAMPLVNGTAITGKTVEVRNPAARNRIVGHVHYADESCVRQAIDVAAAAWPEWNRRPAAQRAAILEKAADLFEENRAELMALCIRETGKTIRDSHADVREAVDFLRYYATGCRELFATPMELAGPTGESNHYSLQGRGPFLCISPWNFPVAIYTGQIAAALAAGNSVIAKPAEQSSLTAALATRLLHTAGVPSAVLTYLPGDGVEIGRIVLSDPRIAGVAFTGSTEAAWSINRTLALRDAPLPVVIAETGGQNAMIVDSSALPEQVVRDVVQSAFNSAGQRCSALRVLYLQQEVAPRIIKLLTGYMHELVIGDPMELQTDIGPVIDGDALQMLERHLKAVTGNAKMIYRCSYGDGADYGNFFAPTLLELDSIKQLRREVFGPVLHIIRYDIRELDRVIDDINSTGYGLTLGIHSRIERRVEHIRRRVRTGNLYINRNMIGAVVGVQPFGGMGLSGTGPKAGGPHYLPRFAAEQTLSINTTAMGGNSSLLAMKS